MLFPWSCRVATSTNKMLLWHYTKKALFFPDPVVCPPQGNMPAPARAAWSTPTTSRPAVAPAAASAPQISAATSPSRPSTAVSVQREPTWMTLGSVFHLRPVPVTTKALWCLLERWSTRMVSCGRKITYFTSFWQISKKSKFRKCDEWHSDEFGQTNFT